LAFSLNHRSVLLTSHKVKSIKGLWKMSNNEPVTATVIDMSQIDHILRGHMTKRFQEVLKGQESTSLSLIYRAQQNKNNVTTVESLDLIVPNPKDYGYLLTALEDLIQVCREEQQYYDRDLLMLRHHWIALQKQDFGDGISRPEFEKLCQRLNVPLKKSHISSLFREQLKELKRQAADSNSENYYSNNNNNNNNNNALLPMWAVSDLLKDVKYHSMEVAGLKYVHNDPLLRIWHDALSTDPVPALKADDDDGGATTFDEGQSLELNVTNLSAEKTISSVAFLSFIRSQQKEFKTTLESALDLMHALNQQTSAKELAAEVPDSKELSTDDRLTKSRLINYLLSDANDLLDPQKGRIGSDDMTQPLSCYWINSSHDTYWNQKTGQLDEQLYLAVLYRGVRCLELDVWDGVNGMPVLAREEPKSADDRALDVTVALQAIRKFLLANPKSFPVIINLENHCSFAAQEKLANLILSILGNIGLIVVPDDTDSVDEADLLPSPDSMRGKVLIMGKRPIIIQEGNKVVNDDFDAENTDYHDDYLPNAKTRDENEKTEKGIVIGFDARGPVRSHDPKMSANVVKHSPGELLFMVKQELEQAKIDAAQVEIKATEMHQDAEKAEAHADKLIADAGLTKDSVWELADNIKGVEIDPVEHVALLTRHEGEGVEIQEFFADAVEGARTGYAQADQTSIEAAEKATTSLKKLNHATVKLREAEKILEEAYVKEQSVVGEYQRAAAGARNKREHADQAERRVPKVRQLLKDCEDSSNSAENVVVTAMTEAKISEKRAVETEARAARAASTAQKERQRADEETRKEEQLERQATVMHEQVTTVTKKAKETRERMEKASAMLDRIIEQINLIEASSQYIRERQEYLLSGEEKKDSRDRRSKTNSEPKGKVIQKHETKVGERRLYASAFKEFSGEAAKAEARRRSIQESFEKCAHLWKSQTEIASKARRQADRSTQLAEELAEHADEEREAANLRRVAREKAKSNVSNKDSSKTSLKAQLAEAQRAHKDAQRTAEQARVKAEELSSAADAVDPHDDLVRLMEKRRAARDYALEDYEAKKKVKDETDLKSSEAKRLFDTSETVYSQAMRNAAKESRRADVQRLADRNAIVAFNRFRLASQQADHALERARYVQGIVEEKQIIVKRAAEYSEKMDKITEIPTSLAKMTFLHTTKHRYWDKSVNLPNTHAHSFSQQVLAQMVEKDPRHPNRLKEFTADHICRTFPSWKDVEGERVINSDPLFQWAVGCQIVAMNYSIFDEHVLKADGRFRRNGSCGYVLKPDALLNYDALIERPEAWTISALCGSCLPSPESRQGNSSGINPFVLLTVYGGAMESKSASHRTRVVPKNGFNPVWDDKKGFTFKATTPSTSILVFQVYDKSEHGSEELIAAAAVPVSCMREGYRSVALFDKNHTRAGAHAHASLLVRAQQLTD
jgi:hypothetical protein